MNKQRNAERRLQNGFCVSLEDKVKALWKVWSKQWTKDEIRSIGISGIEDAYEDMMDITKYWELEDGLDAYRSNNDHNKNQKSLVYVPSVHCIYISMDALYIQTHTVDHHLISNSIQVRTHYIYHISIYIYILCN